MACSEDCGCCFISLLGEISEDKVKTKDPTERVLTLSRQLEDVACSEDCGCCFISLLGEISEDKVKTKVEKLNIGLTLCKILAVFIKRRVLRAA